MHFRRVKFAREPYPRLDSGISLDQAGFPTLSVISSSRPSEWRPPAQGAVPEHWRPGRFWFQDAGPLDRSRDPGPSGRPQRLRSLGRAFRRAREAVAAENTAKGWPVQPDRVFITAGTSEGIELTLTALLDRDGEVLVPMPTYPLYTADHRQESARARVYYRTDPSRGWIPDLEHLATLVTPHTRAIVVIDPNNPTGASYPTPVRRALLEFADRHGLAIVADEVYGDLGLRRVASHRSAASITTRRSFRSRACRRRILRPAGAPAGCRSVARRASTM